LKPSERISILILRELTGESWSLRVPLRLFRFLLVVLVILVILAGFTVTWLGAISARLQSADALSRENAQLRSDLKKLDQLQEDLQVMEEQQRRVLALTQAFLDDSTKKANAERTVDGFYDGAARTKVLQAFSAWLERSLEHRATLSQPIRPLLLRSPVENWALTADRSLGSDSLSVRTILVEPGAPVRSPADALVMSASWDPTKGLELELATTEGYRIHLGRLDQLDVQTGDFVKAGDRIGRTGVGSGVEPVSLSLQVIVNGLAIDPVFAMMR
jgi:septal ring factor EnvC (AmiA/AmiB activator)